METNRWKLMVEKYGSEEAAKAEMARRAAKSNRNKGKKGGFASFPPEKLREIAQRGGKRGRIIDSSNSNSGGAGTTVSGE